MLDGEVVEDPEDDGDTSQDVETGTKTCNGDQQYPPVSGAVSAEDLDGSEKVPLTAPEVETVEDDADTTEMTSLNTKEEHTAGGTAGEETEGKTETRL